MQLALFFFQGFTVKISIVTVKINILVLHGESKDYWLKIYIFYLFFLQPLNVLFFIHLFQI